MLSMITWKSISDHMKKPHDALFRARHIRKKYRELNILVSVDEVLAMMNAAGRCIYCGEDLGQTHNHSLDHKLPRSRGGSDYPDNLHIDCCMRCNRAKGSLTHDEFLQLMRVLRVMDDKAYRNVYSRLVLGTSRFRRR